MSIDQDPMEEEEQYDEDEDEDFNPETNNAQQEQSSSDDSETEAKDHIKNRPKSTPKHEKKPQTEGHEAEDLDFENSGDEGIIKEGTKQEKRRKRKRKDGEQAEDSGGEGGFVQTRSMRAAADPTITRRFNALNGKVTADIDAIWARLKSGSLAPTSTKQEDENSTTNADIEEMITIKRTYTFAGKLHTETKVVPKSSAQAQAYLATKDQRSGTDVAEREESSQETAQVKRGPDGQILSVPKRRKSAWDANPDGYIKGLPSAPTLERTKTSTSALKIINKAHLGGDATLWNRELPELTMQSGRAVLMPSQGPAPIYAFGKQLKAQKLNVVDKSKLDWAEHVDATGAREELEAAKKDKTNYLARKDFLDRVEGKAEDDRLKARGVVA